MIGVPWSRIKYCYRERCMLQNLTEEHRTVQRDLPLNSIAHFNAWLGMAWKILQQCFVGRYRNSRLTRVAIWMNSIELFRLGITTPMIVEWVLHGRKQLDGTPCLGWQMYLNPTRYNEPSRSKRPAYKIWENEWLNLNNQARPGWYND